MILEGDLFPEAEIALATGFDEVHCLGTVGEAFAEPFHERMSGGTGTL